MSSAIVTCERGHLSFLVVPEGPKLPCPVCCGVQTIAVTIRPTLRAVSYASEPRRPLDVVAGTYHVVTYDLGKVEMDDGTMLPAWRMRL